jgi:hypothetical protein
MIGKKLKHFEIEELLGKGDMGTVYRVRDDLSPDEFQRVLREPGVVYIRDDLL